MYIYIYNIYPIVFRGSEVPFKFAALSGDQTSSRGDSGIKAQTPDKIARVRNSKLRRTIFEQYHAQIRPVDGSVTLWGKVRV